MLVNIQHPALRNDNCSTVEYVESSTWFPGSAWEPASWRLCLLPPLHRSHADARLREAELPSVRSQTEPGTEDAKTLPTYTVGALRAAKIMTMAHKLSP